MFCSDSSLDFPTVGDWVVVQYFENNSLAIIHHLLPRKSLLKRKDPGKKVEFQLIASNIDYALIVQSGVIKAVKNRLIEKYRYQNYLKIQKEAVYFDLTYVEKRQMDNELGKMYESFKKSIGKK